MRRGASRILAGLALACLPGAVRGQNPNPMDSIRKLPGYRPALDTTRYLAPERVARYVPAAQRGAWVRYLAASRAMYARDTAAMGAELRAAKMSTMIRAPYAHDFSVKPEMTDAWFVSDAARRLADVILTFQAPNGGWSKHVDFTQHPRQPGESYFAESTDWEWISTIDNDQTTEEINFLSRADAAHRDPRYETSVRRGIDYLLASQMPNGCLPQVFPLEGSYHDAATFNDDATVNVLHLFRAVSDGTVREASAAQRRATGPAVARGIDCILATQVREHGRPTVWGQQHDPLTLQPASARSYELTSLSGLESAQIVDFLMELPSPSPRVVRAVHDAAAWFTAHALSGLRYEHYQLIADPAAPPIWGRLYELGTDRVIMANRDGVKRYDWNQLTDRRSGYGWYTTYPASMLERYAAWAKHHPLPS